MPRYAKATSIVTECDIQGMSRTPSTASTEQSMASPTGTAATTISDASAGVEGPATRTLESLAPTDVIRFANGETITMGDLTAMRAELHDARAAGDFPMTTVPENVNEATVQDYGMLRRLRELRGDVNSAASDAYNRYYVDCTRVIQQRDHDYEVEARNVTIHRRVRELIENQNVGADLHGIVQHAAARGVHQVLANSQAQTLNGDVIREIVQQVTRSLTAEGFNVGQTLDMENVMEDVVTVVEATALDAAGPLRLNVNRLGNINSASENQLRDLTTQVDELRNLTTEVDAMNNHVSAVGNHVNALGQLMQVFNAVSTSTSTQLGEIGGQVQDIQSLVNMIPTLIQQAVQEHLVQTLQDSLAPILPLIVAAIQAGGANGKGLNIKGLATATDTGMGEEKGSPKNQKKAKKGKKGGFFSRLFKRGGKKDDSEGPSGAGLTY